METDAIVHMHMMSLTLCGAIWARCSRSVRAIEYMGYGVWAVQSD